MGSIPILTCKNSYRTTVNPVNVWGNRLPNGSWTGFLGELQRNESDVSFTLFSPTVDRQQLADASDPVWYEEVVILGGFSEASAHQMSIFGSFTVFGLEVWLTLLGCLVVLPFVASLAPNSEHAFSYNLNNFAFRLLAVVFLESSPRTPRQVSARIVVAFWWLAMLVLTNVFSAEMKAALTVRQPSGHRVESASDLAHRDDVKAYTMHGTVYHLLLAYSPREDDRKVASKLTPQLPRPLPPPLLAGRAGRSGQRPGGHHCRPDVGCVPDHQGLPQLPRARVLLRSASASSRT
ncbi:hypothetical protein HPB51_007287 [Rhipicephalus microplus]|uniref:Ionotropic glutamate receptor C-terminal domain-containing protein n=1 Tax=Rhipicephalus microplus TaxID=6941 RepID=A0A9J6E856_RHIMP|nr:hypothetical protein HPB51_007287 [Rhipicephalus microplus]